MIGLNTNYSYMPPSSRVITRWLLHHGPKKNASCLLYFLLPPPSFLSIVVLTRSVFSSLTLLLFHTLLRHLFLAPFSPFTGARRLVTCVCSCPWKILKPNRVIALSPLSSSRRINRNSSILSTFSRFEYWNYFLQRNVRHTK